MNWKLYTRIPFVLLLFLILITGCRKTASVNGLIQSETDAIYIGLVRTDTAYTATYDRQGRLTQWASDSSAPVTFDYSAGSIIQSQGSAAVTYQLNGQGYAASDDQGNTYLYDENGYCTNINNTGTHTTIVNAINNGNLTTRVVTHNAGAGNAIITTHTYQYLDTLDYRSTGETFLGKTNRDLLRAEMIATSTQATTYTYSYTLDGQGRVLTQTINGATKMEVKAYAYE